MMEQVMVRSTEPVPACLAPYASTIWTRGSAALQERATRLDAALVSKECCGVWRPLR
jgi:hypothetical protein